MRIASAGHAVFAATMIALGIAGLIHGDFTPIWQGVPKDFPARPELAYLCAFVGLATGLGLLWRRTAATAARVLFVCLLLWLLLFKLRFITAHPMVEGSYQSCGENAVIVAGAWILYAWFASGKDRRQFDFAIGERGVRMARALYGLAVIAFGLSHFVYLGLTAPLVPGWLPAHTFWAYFTGCTYLIAGAAVIVNVHARLAAALSAVQMGLFTLLVWAPIVAAGHANAGQMAEFVVSWTLTAGAWVVADSWHGKTDLIAHRR